MFALGLKSGHFSVAFCGFHCRLINVARTRTLQLHTRASVLLPNEGRGAGRCRRTKAGGGPGSARGPRVGHVCPRGPVGGGGQNPPDRV